MEHLPELAPFRNWNEKVNAECYRPNTSARILDSDGLLLKKINNYEWISFNYGPTVLDWIVDNDPDTYRAIVEADRWSADNFGGHGSAMAQGYNHTILPLSNARDCRTQVRWAIADFASRFGRQPEGMWLPETAADLNTLRVLAEEGIKFTVLSPYQAAAVRDTGDQWRDVSDGSVDTRFAYRVDVGEGKSVAVFFYDGPLSMEIAFNGLLNNGRMLAKGLVHKFTGASEPELSHVATDGESYGHHHRFGEMALAAAIEEIRHDPNVTLINYGQFLAVSPPTREARIFENTSWSCAHGVERWRSNCGCAPQDHPEWSQDWRTPLRDALDWLRDHLADDFDKAGSELLEDPWSARDAYIQVLLGGSVDVFAAQHLRGGSDPAQREKALKLLESQHRAMLMYTSCAWFFDDLARIEAVYALRQAGSALALSREAVGRDHEPGFLAELDQAVSNDGRNGREIYETEVTPFLRGTSEG